MKLESISSTVFSIGGLNLPKGEYFPHYSETSFNASTGENTNDLETRVQIYKKGSEAIRIFDESKKASEFFDANGDKYGSFADFSEDLALVLGSSFVEIEPSTSHAVKTYAGNVSQVGTAAPTDVVAKSTLGVITWTRTGASAFKGTLADPLLTAGKSIVLVGGAVKAKVTSTTEFTLACADGYLDSTAIKIEVYS